MSHIHPLLFVAGLALPQHSLPRNLQASGPDGIAWGDYDGDGRLDVLAVGAEGRLQLLANRPESGFEDASVAAGLAAIDAVALALWGDYDGDGRADLFVARRAGKSMLLRSETGGFVDVSVDAGLSIEEPVLDAHWLDEDGDGRLDLHVVTEASRCIWRGLDGGFFEPVELGLRGGADGPPAGWAGPTDPAAAHALALSASADTAPRRSPGLAGPPNLGAQAAPRWGPSSPSSANASAPLTPCAEAIRDQANPGTCLSASSAATLGRLYPLSSKLFVSEASGNVGIGTTAPVYRLHVAGKIVSGTLNSATGTQAAVSGGQNNAASGSHAAIGGGRSNLASGDDSTVGGGRSNSAATASATVGGGYSNKALGSESEANTVGGGKFNAAGADSASYNCSFNTVGGGLINYAGGLGSYTYYCSGNTVGGGRANAAGGDFYSYDNTVGGGYLNYAGGPLVEGATVPAARAAGRLRTTPSPRAVEPGRSTPAHSSGGTGRTWTRPRPQRTSSTCTQRAGSESSRPASPRLRWLSTRPARSASARRLRKPRSRSRDTSGAPGRAAVRSPPTTQATRTSASTSPG